MCDSTDTARLPPKLDDLRTVMDACANGDFRRRVTAEGDDEAFATLATSFNEMLDELERQTGQVQGLATVLTEASEDIVVCAEAVRDASVTAGGQTEEIAVNTAEQKQRLEMVAVEMEVLSASIEEISASATTVADTAAETRRRATESQNAAKEALEEVDRILETTDSTAAKTTELER